MDEELDRLFSDFDGGRLSRRDLLRALGLAALAVPGLSLAQGGAGGRGNRAPADTTHAPPPFDATGWKTVWLDHITYQCTDYKKAAPFYSAVMGWKVRHDDGNQIVMDMGDVGGIIMKNGYVAPPPPPPNPAGDSAGRGGRGGGAGARPPRNAAITNFCWGIEPWNTAKVEAELKKRGLNPVAEHAGDFQSFHIKDPDGFDIQVSNGTRANRRKGAANGKLPGPEPFAPTGWKTVWLDHISYGCSDYKRTVAFYEALLGWKQSGPFSGNQSIVDIGDVGGAIIRNRPGGVTTIDHISFGIEGFEPDKVEAELMKRGLGSPNRQDPAHLQPDTGGGGDIHTSKFKSYHTPDPFGWDLQISNITKANRHDT